MAEATAQAPIDERASGTVPALLLRVLRGVGYFYSLGVVLVIWEIVARARIFPPVFLPSVSDVAARLANLASRGLLFDAMETTTYRALVGFALSVIVGAPLGVAMARWRALDWLIEPLVGVGFPAPKIAFIPIFVLWFGVGDESKLFLTVFTCVFPMIVSSYHGAHDVSRVLVWSARAMGTSERRILWKIVIPAALPFIFAGMRVALPLAFIVVVVSEMVTGGGGLGFMLTTAQRRFETDTVIAALVGTLLLGYLADRILLFVRARALRWHEETREEVG